MIKSILSTAALSALLFALPANAQSPAAPNCEGMMRITEEEMNKATDVNKKAAATNSMVLAREMTGKKDEAGCMLQVQNARKAMTGS